MEECENYRNCQVPVGQHRIMEAKTRYTNSVGNTIFVRNTDDSQLIKLQPTGKSIDDPSNTSYDRLQLMNSTSVEIDGYSKRDLYAKSFLIMGLLVLKDVEKGGPDTPLTELTNGKTRARTGGHNPNLDECIHVYTLAFLHIHIRKRRTARRPTWR